ncbi:MAG TPA: hypothetical protein PKN86_11450 [Candidatus Obscuribacter sp.]|nr:hypothetical protein [Candidatus Obscuribacter sp.]HNM50316.1 hypothetical protein [Candidatus Obscuribacter sp.]
MVVGIRGGKLHSVQGRVQGREQRREQGREQMRVQRQVHERTLAPPASDTTLRD